MTGMRQQIVPLACTLALTAVLAASTAAAAPKTLQVDGALRTAGGGPVSDGQYVFTAGLYAAEKGGDAIWKEGPFAIGVFGGRFSRVLGADKALDAKVLAGASQLWLGLEVAPDPELPRVPLHAVLYARHAELAAGLACSGCVGAAHIDDGAISANKVGFTYAGAKTKGGPANVALDLQCTGCVGLGELKIDGDLDLGGNALKAKAVVAASVAATTFVGDGSQLSGIQIPTGNCAKAGEVVKGINKDGSLKCVAAMDPAGLPKDGLDEISNGQLSTEFVDSDSSDKPVPIPDNNPIGVASVIEVPDRGIAKTLTVTAKVANSNFAKVTLELIDPKGVHHILFDGGEVKGGVLEATWPIPTKPVNGDLSAWTGANPKGKWILKVIDQDFFNNGFDGELNWWRVDVQTLSNSKVQAPGTLIVGDRLKGAVQLNVHDKAPVKCDAANVGYMYVDAKNKTLNVCNGEAFFPLAIAVFGTQANPGIHCAHILSVHPAAKSGTYWIDPDGLGGDPAFQVVCDMETEGGGWTRFLHHADPNGQTKLAQSKWDAAITMAAKGGIKEWMVKTFADPKTDSSTGAKPINAWIMNPAPARQGTGFTFFKHGSAGGCNQHRYAGDSYIASAKLLAGSQCKAWYKDDSGGRRLWGEHNWCGRSDKGWLWMSRCGDPVNSHMLIVNHDYSYPPRFQTMISASHAGGKWADYDEDGGAYEFFFR